MKRYFPLFAKAFLVWITAIIAVLVINQTMIERQSAEDILGFLISSFIYLLLLSVAIYFPVLLLLTKKHKERYFKLYPFICGIILNIPFMLFSVAMIGKAFQASEAILFNLMFIIVGTYFGFAFARLFTCPSADLK